MAKTAVMIGGHNKRYRASRDDFEQLAMRLKDFAKTHQRHLILVGSRRTPKSSLAAMSAILGNTPHHIWDGKGANPYPGVLGLADDIIVTSDSVNMASEACLTGKAVYVAELQEETGRIAHFHQHLRDGGYTKALGETFDAPPEILDEMQDIAEQVRRLLNL